MKTEISIDYDKFCVECKKPGATQSGICLVCVLRAMNGKSMKSEAGKIVQRRILDKLPEVKR